MDFNPVIQYSTVKGRLRFPPIILVRSQNGVLTISLQYAIVRGQEQCINQCLLLLIYPLCNYLQNNVRRPSMQAYSNHLFSAKSNTLVSKNRAIRLPIRSNTKPLLLEFPRLTEFQIHHHNTDFILCLD